MDGDAALPDVDVRVVILALRELGEPVDELDRGGEGGELELPHERLVLLQPAVHDRDYSNFRDVRASLAHVRDTTEAGRAVPGELRLCSLRGVAQPG